MNFIKNNWQVGLGLFVVIATSLFVGLILFDMNEARKERNAVNAANGGEGVAKVPVMQGDTEGKASHMSYQ